MYVDYILTSSRITQINPDDKPPSPRWLCQPVQAILATTVCSGGKGAHVASLPTLEEEEISVRFHYIVWSRRTHQHVASLITLPEKEIIDILFFCLKRVSGWFLLVESFFIARRVTRAASSAAA
jgi:hypothetical protein